MEIAFEAASARVTASVHGAGGTAVVLGHGAGGTRRMPALVALADAIASSGRTVLLHDFPYSAEGRRLPDPPADLEATVAAAAACARERGAGRVVVGGRSMGGRMASMAVADGRVDADGLLLLAYPLHPPGNTARLRDAHLPRIAVPTLFVQGTRDDFARFDLLQKAVATVPGPARMHVVEDGDHSFRVRRKSGQDPAAAERGIVEAVRLWLDEHGW